MSRSLINNITAKCRRELALVIATAGPAKVARVADSTYDTALSAALVARSSSPVPLVMADCLIDLMEQRAFDMEKLCQVLIRCGEAGSITPAAGFTVEMAPADFRMSEPSVPAMPPSEPTAKTIYGCIGRELVSLAKAMERDELDSIASCFGVKREIYANANPRHGRSDLASQFVVAVSKRGHTMDQLAAVLLSHDCGHLITQANGFPADLLDKLGLAANAPDESSAVAAAGASRRHPDIPYDELHPMLCQFINSCATLKHFTVPKWWQQLNMVMTSMNAYGHMVTEIKQILLADQYQCGVLFTSGTLAVTYLYVSDSWRIYHSASLRTSTFKYTGRNQCHLEQIIEAAS
jgi:hypothetical protein